MLLVMEDKVWVGLVGQAGGADHWPLPLPHQVKQVFQPLLYCMIIIERFRSYSPVLESTELFVIEAFF